MLSPIKINISKKLLDRDYRHRFFQVRAEDEIASELRQFRKKRKLKQSALASLCDTKQSAISRIEQASYAKWRFDTLLKIAKALDVRVRVSLEDMADVIKKYQRMEAFEHTCSFSTSTQTVGRGVTATARSVTGDAVSPRYQQFLM